MNSDKRLRYRIVSVGDRAGIRHACRTLSRQSRTLGGVYIVIDRASKLAGSSVVRNVLHGAWPVLYVGNGSNLATRVLLLASGLSGSNIRHGFAQHYHRRFKDDHPFERLAVLLIPFNPAWSLEAFLVRLHDEVLGRRPAGNLNRIGRTWARGDEAYTPLTIMTLLPQRRSKL